ncbi:RepB family plasmid replication initiator protein [Escherichia coli]|nr:RepB family plasmid replication initiator protein [Escherichia coli]
MDKSSGELVTLTPNNNNTVQPVALMRLGVFVPTLKSLKNSKKNRHCCKVSDEAAFCLIQRPYISKTLLTRRISPRGSP